MWPLYAAGVAYKMDMFASPLVTDTILDSTHYKLRDLEKRVLLDMFHYNRLKTGLCFNTSRHS